MVQGCSIYGYVFIIFFRSENGYVLFYFWKYVLFYFSLFLAGKCGEQKDNEWWCFRRCNSFWPRRSSATVMLSFAWTNSYGIDLNLIYLFVSFSDYYSVNNHSALFGSHSASFNNHSALLFFYIIMIQYTKHLKTLHLWPAFCWKHFSCLFSFKLVFLFFYLWCFSVLRSLQSFHNHLLSFPKFLNNL